MAAGKTKERRWKKKYCEWDGKNYGSHVHDDGMAPDIQCEKNKKKSFVLLNDVYTVRYHRFVWMFPFHHRHTALYIRPHVLYILELFAVFELCVELRYELNGWEIGSKDVGVLYKIKDMCSKGCHLEF